MNDKAMPGFTGAMSRIKLVTGCETQTELAKFLGIRQSSVADAKKRGNIPSDWLLTLWRKRAINPDWILMGQGAMKLHPVDVIEEIPPSTVYIKEICPPEECTTQELFDALVKRSIKRIRQDHNSDYK